MLQNDAQIVNNLSVDDYLDSVDDEEEIDPLLLLMLKKAQKAGYGKNPVGGDDLYERFYPTDDEIENPSDYFDLYED